MTNVRSLPIQADTKLHNCNSSHYLISLWISNYAEWAFIPNSQTAHWCFPAVYSKPGLVPLYGTRVSFIPRWPCENRGWSISGSSLANQVQGDVEKISSKARDRRGECSHLSIDLSYGRASIVRIRQWTSFSLVGQSANLRRPQVLLITGPPCLAFAPHVFFCCIIEEMSFLE